MILSILFEHLGLVAHLMSAVAQHVVVQGVRFSSQGDVDRGLVGQGALHGRAQDRHRQVLHVGLLVPPPAQTRIFNFLHFKERDRDP